MFQDDCVPGRYRLRFIAVSSAHDSGLNHLPSINCTIALPMASPTFI